MRPFALLPTLLAGGCAVAMMTPPPEVSSGYEELAAVDRKKATGLLVNEDFTLGRYQVVDVRRKASRTTAEVQGATTETDEAGRYSFTLMGGPEAVAGVCSTDDESVSTQVGGGASLSTSQHRVFCSCGQASLTGDSMDVLGAGVVRTRDGDGQLVASDRYVTDKAPDRDRRLFGAATGYRLQTGGGMLAAVDVLGPGRMWLRTDLSPESQAELACLATGLLLYRSSEP